MRIEELRKLAKEYYSREDIQRAIVSFSKDREVIPRYNENFGKRPDTINYINDILSLVNKGVTSFHASEEIWHDPLRLNTEMNPDSMNELRKGWDLILDIDCKFLEYSKITAELLVEAMKFHGINNIGIKYSGNKGFHIGLAFEAFPEKVKGIDIKNFFPEGPRIVAGYLSNLIKENLAKRILEMNSIEELAKLINQSPEYFYKKICRSCKVETIKKKEWREIGRDNFEEIEIIECPECHSEYNKKNYDKFEIIEEFSPYSILEIDTVLISPRHLFRMPYSLHEKTGFASIVVNPSQLKDFHPALAKPFRVIPKQFLPKPEKEEAKKLIMQALDWNSEKQRNIGRIRKPERKAYENHNETRNIEFKEINPDFFPPCIKKILNGVKEDGRKRALFILINFFRSLNTEIDEIEKKIGEWNKLNYKPLKTGYINSQLDWFKKHKIMLPPNCDKSHYKGIGACFPDSLCSRIKNPVYYTKDRLRMSSQNNKPQKKRKSFK